MLRKVEGLLRCLGDSLFPALEPRRLRPRSRHGRDLLKLPRRCRQLQRLVERCPWPWISTPGPHEPERHESGMRGSVEVRGSGERARRVDSLRPAPLVELRPCTECEQIEPVHLEATLAAVSEPRLE